jgi:hypothetical protein
VARQGGKRLRARNEGGAQVSVSAPVPETSIAGEMRWGHQTLSPVRS